MSKKNLQIKISPKNKLKYDKLLELLLAGRSMRKAMLEVGFAPSVARSGHIRSKAWSALLETYLPDRKLLRRHRELLNKKEAIVVRDDDGARVEVTDQPDAHAVGKALELAYKIKKKFVPLDDGGGRETHVHFHDEKIIQIVNQAEQDVEKIIREQINQHP